MQQLQAQDQAHSLEWLDLEPGTFISPEHFSMQEGMNLPVHLTHPDRPAVIGRACYGLVGALVDDKMGFSWYGLEVYDSSTRQVRPKSLLLMWGCPDMIMLSALYLKNGFISINHARSA